MADRRSRRVVETFQLRLCVRIAAYAFIYQLTVWNLMFCLRLYKTGGDFFTEYRNFFVDSYPMLLCVLVLAPAFAWDAAKHLHRIAGPLYRFRQTMKEITAGEPIRRIKLRTGDELKPMQDDFNAMIDTLARRGAINLIDPSPVRDAGSDQEPQLLRLAQ